VKDPAHPAGGVMGGVRRHCFALQGSGLTLPGGRTWPSPE
jgi:hypothetical protein